MLPLFRPPKTFAEIEITDTCRPTGVRPFDSARGNRNFVTDARTTRCGVWERRSGVTVIFRVRRLRTDGVQKIGPRASLYYFVGTSRLYRKSFPDINVEIRAVITYYVGFLLRCVRDRGG